MPTSARTTDFRNGADVGIGPYAYVLSIYLFF